MARLYSKSSIQQVVLRNGQEPLDRAFDSLVVRDPQTLEIIRNLILETGFINLNRYSPDWEIDIIITMDTGTEFTIGLKRSTTEGETDSGYKIYFNEECDGNYRYGSRDLGHKIMEMIQNR
jgi:hypothetical protein